MSRAGLVGPICLRRSHAAVVGEIIVTRTAGFNLEQTALQFLPAFGRKLASAAKRKGRASDELKLWTATKAEGLAGFHYLSLFLWPDVPSMFLTKDETEAVRQVRLAVTGALTARQGPRPLAFEEASARVRVGREGASAEDDPDILDRRWVQRLAHRVEGQEKLRSASPKAVPYSLFVMLAPPKYRISKLP